MSNTTHQIPWKSLHSMRVQNRRKSEMAVLDELSEFGIVSRHINRLKSFWTQIPEPWDDKPHAAWKEYHNKHHWQKIFNEDNIHWTRNNLQFEA